MDKLTPVPCFTAASLAIANNFDEIAIKLIKSGAQIYLHGDETVKDNSPIFLSIAKRKLEILEYILGESMQKDCDFLNSDGQTPIMFAAELGFSEIVEYLSLRNKNLNLEGDANG